MAGAWVIFSVASDPTVPVAGITVTPSNDTTNPVRMIGQSINGSGSSGVALTVFAHKVTTTTSRSYQVDFGASGVVAKHAYVWGEFSGSDVPDDSETVIDDHFGYSPSSGLSSTTAPGGWISSPLGKLWGGALAIAAVEDAGGNGSSWTNSQPTFAEGAGSRISTLGTTGSSGASNVAQTRYFTSAGDGVGDEDGDMSVTVTWDAADRWVMIALRIESFAEGIHPTSLSSGEAFGTATVTTGPVGVAPSGIASTEALGTANVHHVIRVFAPALASEEAVGTPTVEVGPALISPSGVASEEGIGDALVSLGEPPPPEQTLFCTAIETAESLGTPGLARTIFVATPPSRRGAAMGGGGLLSKMRQTEGVTHYRIGETWYSGNYFPDDLEADEIYLGGYDHEVTSEKAIELEALGFTIRTEER